MERPPITFVKQQDPEASALERLTLAVQLSENLGELADHVVGHFVDQARRTGASWTDIGQSMGVTKQAAQKRFVPRPSQPDLATGNIFARFTDRARKTVVGAQDGARAAGNHVIEPEHLLLALLDDEDSMALRAIAAGGTSPGALREAVRATLPAARDGVPQHIPFTPRSKTLLNLTAREALRLGHTFIGTEHILLGLLSDEGSDAARILAAQGVAKRPIEEYVRGALRQLEDLGDVS
jgi:hypothetical protein